jgi:DNA-directed RNA polymerase sigma subunit (sigma70/sigma32)
MPEQVNYIADQLKVDYHEIVDMNGRMRGDVSLNVPTTGEDASEQLQNWLVDPAPDPESLLSEAEDRNRLRTALKDALAALSPRERHIIGARFLVDQPKTLEELGLTFGVSHERVHDLRATVTRCYPEGRRPSGRSEFAVKQIGPPAVRSGGVSRLGLPYCSDPERA